MSNVASFERAVAIASLDPDARLLALHGLCVANERLTAIVDAVARVMHESSVLALAEDMCEALEQPKSQLQQAHKEQRLAIADLCRVVQAYQAAKPKEPTP